MPLPVILLMFFTTTYSTSLQLNCPGDQCILPKSVPYVHWIELAAQSLLNIGSGDNKKCALSLMNLTDTAMKAASVMHSCAQNGNVSKSCMAPATDRLWAWQTLDAWGRVAPGLFQSGQMLWYGDYEQCRQVQPLLTSQQTHYCSIKSSTFEQFIVQSGVPRVHWGVCVPVVCSEAMLEQALRTFIQQSSIDDWLPALDQHAHVYCHKQTPSIFSSNKQGSVVLMVFAGLLLVLVLLGTFVDLMRTSSCQRKRRLRRRRRNRPVASGSSASQMCRVDLDSQLSYKSFNALRKSFNFIKWTRRFLTAFSIRLNWSWLIRGDSKRVTSSILPGRISSVYGVRCIAMWWIIVAHSHLFSLPHVANLRRFVEATVEQPAAQIMLNASLSVDTFFVISGLLAGYQWAKRVRRRQQTLDKNGNTNGMWHLWSLQPIALCLVHRLARLISPVVAVLSVASTIFPDISHGPAWQHDQLLGAQCSDSNHWWRHLLFISNYFETRCLPWLWYLALDMQFFVMTPALFAIMNYSHRVSVAVCSLLVGISFVTTGYTTVKHSYTPNMLLFLPDNGHYNQTAIKEAFADIYNMPYTRMGVYVLGAWFGWELVTRGHFLYVGKRAAASLWSLAVVLSMWSVFGALPLYAGWHNAGYVFLYAGASRLAFATSVCLVIWLSQADAHPRFLVSALCWSGWRPMARLTFSAFLTHELLMIADYHSMQQPWYFDGHSRTLWRAVAHLVCSYALALPFSLMVEWPPIGIERLLFRRLPRAFRRHRARRRNMNKPLAPSIDWRLRTGKWITEPDCKLSDSLGSEGHGDEQCTLLTQISSAQSNSSCDVSSASSGIQSKMASGSISTQGDTERSYDWTEHSDFVMRF